MNKNIFYAIALLLLVAAIWIFLGSDKSGEVNRLKEAESKASTDVPTKDTVAAVKRSRSELDAILDAQYDTVRNRNSRAVRDEYQFRPGGVSFVTGAWPNMRESLRAAILKAERPATRYVPGSTSGGAVPTRIVNARPAESDPTRRIHELITTGQGFADPANNERVARLALTVLLDFIESAGAVASEAARSEPLTVLEFLDFDFMAFAGASTPNVQYSGDSPFQRRQWSVTVLVSPSIRTRLLSAVLAPHGGRPQQSLVRVTESVGPIPAGILYPAPTRAELEREGLAVWEEVEGGFESWRRDVWPNVLETLTTKPELAAKFRPSIPVRLTLTLQALDVDVTSPVLAAPLPPQ